MHDVNSPRNICITKVYNNKIIVDVYHLCIGRQHSTCPVQYIQWEHVNEAKKILSRYFYIIMHIT